jgi:acetylornithine/N-succinyldiaminopimelate aminotransferase
VISNVMPTYSRIDVTFERGKGAYLFDSEGRQYLDFASGIAVNALGHCHPHLVEAVQEQASKLWHTSNLYHIPGQQKLADRLVAATFADSVFFANSGAEAVECSLKMSRKYQSDHGHPERYRVITCINAFHGRTLATIAAGGQGKHLTGFSPSVDGFDQVAFGDLNKMRAAIGPETAAIMVEPVQGEGGINVAHPAYLKGLREAADEFNLLLIFDEVQCGMGRTGKLFAHEWAGVIPDIMPVAKGIGGGFPVAACLASESAALALSAGSHGSTFGGNPMAMAAANAVCDVIMAPGFLDGVDKVAKNLRARLDALAEEYPGVVKGIRGSGLMIGIDCAGNSVDFRAKLHEGGLLSVGAAGNVIRLLPPLIIEQNHIDEAIEILSTVCAKIKTDG